MKRSFTLFHHISIHRTSTYTTPLLILLSAFILSGCGFFNQEPELQIDIANSLPNSWRLVNNEWPKVLINIDGDEIVEYLIYYQYDNGQYGAVVYDPVDDSRFATEQEVPLPNQPSAIFPPYHILPHYWEGKGQGFIAGPGGAPTIRTVTRHKTGSFEEEPPDELTFTSWDRYTVAWWKNEYEGYGVTQIHAPGGFHSWNWGDGDAENRPAISVIGQYPLHDRSLLCKEALFVREVADQNDYPTWYRSPVEYDKSPLGLTFCYGTPAYPFYAEGVVLAYLLDAAGHQALLDSQSNAQEINRVIDAESIDRIDDIRAYLDIKPSRQKFPIGETAVCVEVIRAGEQRWLNFGLKHIPQDIAAKTTDRWAIKWVEPIPNPPDAFEKGCSHMIGDGTPDILRMN